MKPLLNWVGGKRHTAPAVVAQFPEHWESGTYFEPFLGGAAIFLHTHPARSVLSDVNGHLIRFYTDLKNDPNQLIERVRYMAETFDSLPENRKHDFYTDIRNQFNENPNSEEHSAIMYCLNKLCFNGSYRENSKGKFNVHFGKRYKFPEFLDEEFLAVSSALQNAKLLVSDFEDAVKNAVDGDFVYFDPPYVPTDSTFSSTTYSALGFGLDQHERLAHLMIRLASRGVKALVSNSATPVTRNIYAGLRLETITAPRMMSVRVSGRGKVNEFLIMNY